MSESKKIVLGVSASIAAHKAIDLASLLTKAGCVVDVVLTRDAQEFVKPLPFQTLTRRRVITSLYDEEETGVAHIRAADEADLLLIAPATANTLAKLAHGLADDALGHLRAHQFGDLRNSIEQLQISVYDYALFDGRHACPEPALPVARRCVRSGKHVGTWGRYLLRQPLDIPGCPLADPGS